MPAGTAFTMRVGGASFLSGHDSVRVGVAGNTIGVSVYAGEDFGLVERVEPTRFLAIGGFATGPIAGSAGSTFTAPLRGDIAHCATQSELGWNYDCSAGRVAFESCSSETHQLRLQRR